MAMHCDWIEWDKTRCCIPDPKNGQPHVVHLSAPAIAELLALSLDGIAPSTGPVLTTTGSTPMSGFVKPKDRLDATINAQRAQQGNPCKIFARFVPPEVQRRGRNIA